MGCCCCSSESNQTPPPLLSRKMTLGTQGAVSSINNENLAKRFTAQVEKLNSLHSLLHKYNESSKAASAHFISSLKNLEFYFSKKSIETSSPNLEGLECPNCLLLFNSDSNIPLQLSCGHSICEPCALNQFTTRLSIECTIDKLITNGDPSSFQKNESLMAAAKAIQNGTFCFIHFIVCNLFCFDCNKMLCAECRLEHATHSVNSFESDESNKAVMGWERNLEAYMKKLTENLGSLSKHSEGFEEVQQKMMKVVEDYVEAIRVNREAVIETIQVASKVHVEFVSESIKEMMGHMPKNNIRLYCDAIQAEMARAQDMMSGVNNLTVGEKLRRICQADLKTQNTVGRPNMVPWNDTLESLEKVSDFEALVLALASIPNN